MTTETKIKATGIDCVCYLAKDFDRAKRFYTETLGLNPSTESESWTEFELGDGNAFAVAKMPDGKWYQCGGTMFAVPDIEAALAQVRATGVTIYGDIFDSPVCRMAWCEDTEGNNFGLHQRI